MQAAKPDYPQSGSYFPTVPKWKSLTSSHGLAGVFWLARPQAPSHITTGTTQRASHASPTRRVSLLAPRLPNSANYAMIPAPRSLLTSANSALFVVSAVDQLRPGRRCDLPPQIGMDSDDPRWTGRALLRTSCRAPGEEDPSHETSRILVRPDRGHRIYDIRVSLLLAPVLRLAHSQHDCSGCRLRSVRRGGLCRTWPRVPTGDGVRSCLRRPRCRHPCRARWPRLPWLPG